MSVLFSEASKHGAHGFDANTVITASAARKLRDAGFAFGVRYLTRSTAPASNDLSKEEVDTILSEKMALMAVQHVAREGWKPSESLGQTYGTNAAAHARAVELPVGTTVWLDLEGVHSSVSAEAIISYCNAWHKEVEEAGFLPGIYVGANCGLSGDQLYWQLRMKHYWRSGSTVPDIPARGYCMEQRILVGDKVGGVEIDRNVILEDRFGDLPFWATRSTLAQDILARPPQTQPEDAATLLELADIYGLTVPMQRMLEYRNVHSPMSTPRYWAIVNFNLHSAKPRMFLFDRLTPSVKSYLCAHGKGSEGASDDGMADVFSNEDGSGCSSLGIYRCAETYFGDHGKSLRLDGLESTNSRARHRAIVIHGADYVSEDFATTHKGRIGRSLGCPAVENQFAKEIVEALADGSLLNIWSSR